MKKRDRSEPSEKGRINRTSRTRIVVEVSAVLVMIAAPTLASLGCSLFWGSEFQTLQGDRQRLELQSAAAFDIVSFESMVIRLRFVPVILFVMWQSGERWSRFGLVRPKFWKDILLGLCIWLIVAVLDCLIAVIFRRHDPWHFFSPVATSWVRAVLLAGHYCAVGFGEELAMRAYLIPRLEAITGSTSKSIVFSVLVFGSLHLYKGYVSGIHAIAAAIVFGIAFSLTRRIWPVAIAHALGDFIVSTHLV